MDKGLAESYHPEMIRAFSLVELSIVLVILGLLTGGILAGKSLIRASELRAITTEYQRYTTAVQAFRDKYFAVPGDMTNATSFWGNLSGTGCTNNAGTSAVATGTCDGNGDGRASIAAAVSQTGESFQFWRQLALAGLVEGTYSGLAGAGTAWPGNDNVFGTNSPSSKMGNTGWAVMYLGTYGDGSCYTSDYGNMLAFGRQYTGNLPITAALKPEEQWNIDTKMDDGKPGTGKIMARDSVGFAGTNPCTTSTSQTDYAGAYNLSNSAVSCTIWAPKAF